jgi:hypothetical protein
MIGKTVSHLLREINEASFNYETVFSDYRIYSKLLYNTCISHLPCEINENSFNYETVFSDYRIYSKLLYNTCISQGKQNQQ